MRLSPRLYAIRITLALVATTSVGESFPRNKMCRFFSQQGSIALYFIGIFRVKSLANELGKVPIAIPEPLWSPGFHISLSA